ncbi:hypothetical protein FHS31_002544 [Sphingomonas vulcanisoli]|uniref:Uncharacterized protein n=1 Tax=Sphingomonas vulcanisoli TaxID=1658060 RepID=A0ABX0TYU4_9SPHN|nr:hypothetical protein [Sphingomonas vulcanisoli]NIJ08920.1 hypothetical protein [Sphingomonas vulcanisoli]
MRRVAASLVMGLVAGAAGAQLIPLGTPLMPQPKTAAPPPSAQDQTGRMRAARPLGSNYSPYSIQPLSGVTTAAPSSVPGEGTIASGVVTDSNAPINDARKPAKPSAAPSDLQKLAPKAAERTEMPKADTNPDPSASR